ncbi:MULTISPECIES: Imm27 family immunity protein [Flavobacterium]|uniref:Imm27 family immunity protein n=1 Tax=Flavobacterium TaxID=237 RepID=UPI001FCC3C3C|nr:MULTISPECIES: Imm27 family immunity protein [Flavobacterium]UOK41625.1 immunity 27 family protein [Flavobacterium enshiense]
MEEQILTAEKLLEKKKTLTKVKTDDSGWYTYYVDENSQKWLEEYPNSECHGGGLPQLRLLDKFPWE